MLSSVTQLLHEVLVFLAGYTHDFGIAIVLLTIIIRVLLLPLSVKIAKTSIVQMKLTPKLHELKNGWKGSKLELAKAEQELLKKHGVRPFSQVLFVLVQSPVFLVLYKLMQHLNQPTMSILVPWVASLSQIDPFYILSIVSAVLVVAGTFITYAQMQIGMSQVLGAAVSFIMTIAILWSAPAAVSLYYTTSSLWGTIERMTLGKLLSKWAPRTAY